MAGLTPFGIAIRKVRLDKGLKLLDMAQKIGVTSTFLWRSKPTKTNTWRIFDKNFQALRFISRPDF